MIWPDDEFNLNNNISLIRLYSPMKNDWSTLYGLMRSFLFLFLLLLKHGDLKE